MTTQNDPERYRAAEFLTAEVERTEHKKLLGADLGQLYARHFPALKAELSLSQLLNHYADRLTVVDRAGQDLVWGTNLDDDAPDVDLENLDSLLQIDEFPASVDGVQQGEVGLSRARFVNYKVLGDVTIELGKLTVLVGANASGKSTILDALFRGSLLTTRKPASVFDGPNDLTRVRRRGAAEGVRLAFHDQEHARFEFAPDGPADVIATTFSYQIGKQKRQAPTLLGTPLHRHFGGAALLRLDARQLSRPTYSPELQPYLRHDGLYLPSVLSYLAAEDPERLVRILDGVREVIPQVRQVRMPREEIWRRDAYPGSPPMIGNRLEVLFGETGWTPADQLSEGTLLTLGLHTILSRARPPRLLLFDDVDRALHPNAQRRLIQQLKALASTDCQIVCSTHSPYVLEALDASQVRVVQVDAAGQCHVSALTTHPEWKEWASHMNAGEFWQFAGDAWLEGR